jgi:hypothetical protein
MELHIIATFKHSKKIEIALADLKNIGLNNSEILALPLDNRASNLKLVDSKKQSDRESVFDIAAILGMVLMLLGCIYGFVLKWGPIIWALIGLVIGIIIGLAIKFSFVKRNRKRNVDKNDETSEIVLIVNCSNYQGDKVKKILWDNGALGMTTFEK